MPDPRASFRVVRVDLGGSAAIIAELSSGQVVVIADCDVSPDALDGVLLAAHHLPPVGAPAGPAVPGQRAG